MNTGFGQAQIKPEGMCFSPDDSSIRPWDGLKKEFEAYFKTKYPFFPWYLRWFVSKDLLRRILLSGWSQALFTNARKKKE